MGSSMKDMQPGLSVREKREKGSEDRAAGLVGFLVGILLTLTVALILGV